MSGDLLKKQKGNDMKVVTTVTYDDVDDIMTDSGGATWVRGPQEPRQLSVERLIKIANSCSFMPVLMVAVEIEMLKAINPLVTVQADLEEGGGNQ